MLFGVGLALAIFLRIFLINQGNFPLHDGGMFYVMIRDLQASHYALPRFTTYNSLHIPFAYPPLGFYVAGIVSDATGASLLEILRILPLLLNIAAIGAFSLLARSVLRSGVAAAAAVLAFSFLPHSVLWQIMGGGLTRGFGLLFALLALHQGYELFARCDYRRIVPATLFCSLTVLSHPKMAWFLAYSLALFVCWFVRERRGVLAAFAVAAGTIAFTAPWWGTVIAWHGVAPFVASMRPGSTPFGQLIGDVLRLNFTAEPLAPAIGIVAGLGVLVSVRSRQWMLLIWLALVIPLDSREYLTDSLVPVALLVGRGAAGVMLPTMSNIQACVRPGRRVLVRTLIATGLLLYVALDALAGTVWIESPLPPSERAAMAWISTNTSKTSRFVVESGDSWWGDKSSEWFPALTGRASLGNVQGTEWLSNKTFPERIAEYSELQNCAVRSTSCLDSWEADTGETFNYVYVTKRQPIIGNEVQGIASQPTIGLSLRDDPRYHLVFENSGVDIFMKIDSANTTP